MLPRLPHAFRLASSRAPIFFTPLRSLTSKPPPPPKRRALTDAALVGAGVIAIGGVAVWVKNSKESSSTIGELSKQSGTGQFEIPLANRTGSPPTKKTLTMLTPAETDRILKKGEATFEVNRPGNPVYRYDTNAVASNSPIEDDSVTTIVSRSAATASASKTPTPTTAGDLLFFGIFDGHSGWQTSRLLSERLVPYVGRELESVIRGDPEYAALSLGKQIAASDNVPKDASQGYLERLWDTLLLRSGGARITDLDADPEIVAAALRKGFVKLDEEIVQSPVKLLKEVERKGWKRVREGNNGAQMTPEQTTALQTLLPALSGSCAILALVDTARETLHVATTGDSRALMGVWEPSKTGKGGKWRAEILSEDQEGTNPKEIQRMRAEHPASEADQVIMRGRVLGGLQPTRAFDKWAVGIQEKLYAAFHPGSARRSPQSYLTPPYVTAEPVVTTTTLPSSSSPAAPNSSGTQGFIVVATDGLWDRLANDEVVGLVGAWLEGTRGSVSRSNVLSRVGEMKEAHVSPHTPKRESGANKFVFEDTNIGTHLIRNALGGAQRDQVSALLSIPAPHSRRYRDDITVTVVLLGQGERDGQLEGVRKVSVPLTPRAKL